MIFTRKNQSKKLVDTQEVYYDIMLWKHPPNHDWIA